MLTLNALGKHGGELVNFLRGSLKDSENDLKILIDGPVQLEEVRKFLEPLNFSDFVLEDDEGNLFVTTSKKIKIPDEKNEKEKSGAIPVKEIPAVQPHMQISIQPQPQKIQPRPISQQNIKISHSTGILISCETGKYKKIFMQKILSSLVFSKIKPEVLALMNGAVSLAAYNSESCGYLKELEDSGVKILISESCADYMGITEALGAGMAVDMSEIFEEIFSCERVVSL